MTTPPPFPQRPGSDLLFECLAKWEQNFLTHSPGRVTLSSAKLSFLPGAMSVLGRTVEIPFENITSVKKRDNFLWRGAVRVNLRSEFESHNRFVFFLGNKREEFLSKCETVGIAIE